MLSLEICFYYWFIYYYFFRFQELIYHSVAAVLLLIASIYLLVKISDYKGTNLYDVYIVVAVSVRGRERGREMSDYATHIQAKSKLIGWLKESVALECHVAHIEFHIFEVYCGANSLMSIPILRCSV